MLDKTGLEKFFCSSMDLLDTLRDSPNQNIELAILSEAQLYGLDEFNSLIAAELFSMIVMCSTTPILFTQNKIACSDTKLCNKIISACRKNIANTTLPPGLIDDINIHIKEAKYTEDITLNALKEISDGLGDNVKHIFSKFMFIHPPPTIQ
jgi:hypothetical protein